MVCEVSIAVSQGRKQQQQQQNDEENDGKTAWYTVVAWDEEAVRLNEHVRKRGFGVRAGKVDHGHVGVQANRAE